MKILMFTPLFHPHIGGVEKHVKRISEELIKKGHEISLITMQYDPTVPCFEELNKIKIYRFSRMRLPGIWSWIYKSRKLIKSADVIHCHDFSTFIFWYLPFRFLYLSKPVFITFHGHEGILPIPKKTVFMRRIAELLTRGNICIGDFIPKWYGTKANFVSYGGADRTEYGTISPKNSVVFIGRLEKDTGIMAYITAVKILKDNYHIDIQVNICGDGSLRQIIEKSILKYNLNITLCGFVEEPIDYLMGSKFAFVTGYLAILEAMVNKKLVFSIYENELKRDYLICIPNSKNMMVLASSSEELADELAYYYTNPEKSKKITEDAYNFARELTWDSVAYTYLKLWGVEK